MLPSPPISVDLAGPVALVIGNEGNGVAEDLIAKADVKVTIPCPGPVESLNAAVAASVLLYEAARQRGMLNPVYGATRPDGERVRKQTPAPPILRATRRGARR